MTNRAAIILAAGKGSRMHSRLPKGLHRLGGRTLLDWSLELAESLSCDPILLVSAPDVPELAQAADTRAKLCVQDKAQGTADAVNAAAQALDGFQGQVIVLYVDTPLVSHQTCNQAFAVLEQKASALAVLGFEPEYPGQYGRLITGADGRLLRIVEARDASPEEAAIGLCNSGVMAGQWPLMQQWLKQIGCDNARGEYYLTDLVELACQAGKPAALVRAQPDEVAGVNSRLELAGAEQAFQHKARRQAMDAGVCMLAPETVFFSWDTQLDAEVTIEPYTVFGPGVRVESGSHIRSFSYLEGVHIEADCQIGPFARLRPGTQVHKGAAIGNFVEAKNAQIGPKSKAGHLAYIGDAEIGAESNIGAGTIFCNYDGHHKHKTVIGKGSFIGSNTSLIAPLNIGAGAYIGSGSVINQDVPEDALALGRSRQTNKPNWATRFRKTLLRSKSKS